MRFRVKPPENRELPLQLQVHTIQVLYGICNK